MSNISRGLTRTQYTLFSYMAVSLYNAKRALGQRIRTLRLRDSISQEDLAYKAGVERSYMGRIERGEGNPSFKKIVDIANALKVTPKELLFE